MNLLDFKRFYLPLMVLVGLVQNTKAQEPIVVNVVVMPPYPNYADELITLGDEAIITIQNTDFTNGYEVKLGIEMDGSNGISIRSRDDALPSQAIVLGPGETQILTGSELSDFYNNYDESNFEFTGITVEEVLNDQSLPDGVYTVCVRAYNFQTNIPLSASSPNGCAAPFTVIAIDPPIITYPQDDMVLSPQDPQLFNINWLPVTVAIPDLRYRLEMVELDNELINPYDAFSTPDFLFLFEDNIVFNSFLYGMEYPLLEIGTQYAIRMRAYREDGLLNVLNQGYSDIVIFRYGEAEEDDQAQPIDHYTPSVSEQNMDCGSGCSFNIPSNMLASPNAVKVGSTLSLGHYELLVSTASPTGSSFQGTGVIQATDYFPVGIKVNFSGLRATSSGRVIDGTAEAFIRNDSWIDHTWSDVQSFVGDVSTGNDQNAWESATNPDFYIDNLTTAYQQIGTSLPINIGAGVQKIQVVGMHFYPDRASYNLAYFQKLDDDMFGEKFLSFLAKDLCISPEGPAIGANEAQLDLVKTVQFNFDSKTTITFDPNTGPNTGTMLKFDCDGFNEIQARGTVRFDPSVFKPVDKNGVQQADTVIAHFYTSFVEWSDWVAYLDFVNEPSLTSAPGVETNEFVYTELDNYVLRVDQAFFDHSIAKNPSGMEFPSNFNGVSSADWQGTYIKQVEVELPPWVESFQSQDKKTRIMGRDLLVDSDGLTGIIAAENVLAVDAGSLGSWGFSITDLEIEIVQNSLVNGKFAGSLSIPVVEEPFNYETNIQFAFGATVHTFDLNPTGNYTFPVWFADATISENSNIHIATAEENVVVTATLHGSISFAPVIGDIDKNNLTDITFNDMIIRNKRAPTYIEFGNIGTNISPTTLAIAGFGVALEKLEWEESTLQKAGLIVGVGLDLAGGLSTIRGGTELFLKTKIENHVDSISFIRDGTSLAGIYIEAETGAVNVKGEVNFFNDNSEFGSGFDGELKVSFLESISLKGNVLFGNKEINGNKTNYWYAFAMAWMPNSPVPFATPVDIYAFGGGVYYNMAVNQNMPNPQAIGGSTVNPREAFIVSPGTTGLQASVVLGLTPSSRTFNADVTLTAEFDHTNFGLNYINFTGAGYVMQKIDAPNKDDAMVTVTVGIEYDFPQKTLSANMGVEGDIPKSNTLLTISGEISFLRSPNLWYFRAGVPKDPLITSLDLGIAGLDAGAYFMTGQRIPPPVFPTEVQKFFNFNSTLANNLGNDLGIGFLAGVHLGLSVDFSALGTGLSITALAGVDISLMHWYAALCNGSDDFGVNRWYAMGQGYVYGNFSFDIATFEAASIQMGVILEGAFPNPTGVRGTAKAKLTALLGLIEEEVSVSFSIGEMCNMTPVDMETLIASGDFERPEAELDSLDMIGQITPPHLATFVSTTVKPTIEWTVKPDETKHYAYGNGFGGLVEKEFKFSLLGRWYRETEDNTWETVNSSSTYDDDNYVRTYAPVNSAGDPALISGSNRYKVRATAEIREKVAGQWRDALYLEGPKQGQPIKQVKEHIFTTITNLTQIDPLYIDYTLPYERQRYYPYDHLKRGHLKFNTDHEAKFQNFENCGFEIYAEFKPLTGNTWERMETTREDLLKMRYDMASLAPSTVYELRIIAERTTTQNELAEETEPDCQLPGPTLFDLFDENELSLLNPNGQEAINLDGDIASNYAGFQNITAEVTGAPQNNEEIIQTKVLFTLYFRTSMYATPDEKLENIEVVDVQIKTESTFVWPTIINFRRAFIGLNCGEGFDKYDVLGHDYQAQAGLTNQYFGAYGPNCENTMTGDPQAWFENLCYGFYGYGSGHAPGEVPIAGQAAEIAALKTSIRSSLPWIGDVKFRADLSNYSGLKHIMPLLSDTEIGLAAPTALDPITVINFLGGNSTDSDSKSSGANVSNNSNSNPFTNITSSEGSFSLVGLNTLSVGGAMPLGSMSFGAGSGYKLELDFNADRVAYDARLKLLVRPDLFPDIGSNHIPLPNGLYPIILQTTDFTDDTSPQPIGSPKTIEVIIE